MNTCNNTFKTLFLQQPFQFKIKLFSKTAKLLSTEYSHGKANKITRSDIRGELLRQKRRCGSLRGEGLHRMGERELRPSRCEESATDGRQGGIPVIEEPQVLPRGDRGCEASPEVGSKTPA